MKISKDEVLALIEGIERATMDAPIPDALRALKERAQTPDGPFEVFKTWDQRGHKVWGLRTDSRDPMHDIDLYDGGAFDHWHYEKQDAEQACDSLNRLVASHVANRQQRLICVAVRCDYQTDSDPDSRIHQQIGHGHIMITNAKWKQQQRDQRLL